MATKKVWRQLILFSYSSLLLLDSGRKSSGSGINTRNPQHCFKPVQLYHCKFWSVQYGTAARLLKLLKDFLRKYVFHQRRIGPFLKKIFQKLYGTYFLIKRSDPDPRFNIPDPNWPKRNFTAIIKKLIIVQFCILV